MGFFTREDRRTSARSKQEVSTETLWKMGLEGVRRLNPTARTKNMEPEGSDEPDVYVLGGAPTEAADRRGVNFEKSTKRWFDRRLSRVDVRYGHVCRTFPPKGRPPKREEIECYRPSLVEDIERSTPKLVLVLGGAAIGAVLGRRMGPQESRGFLFPTKIGDHECFVMPMYDPSLFLDLGGKRWKGVPGEEFEKIAQRDLWAALQKVISWKIQPRIGGTTEEDLYGDVTCCTTYKAAMSALQSFKESSVLSLDIETHGLRPYGKEAAILSVSVGDDQRTIAFPLDHPDCDWTEGQKAAVRKRLRFVLKRASRVIAHNAIFEIEWLIWQYNWEIAYEVNWFCTQSLAFLDDGRKGGLSLDFLVRRELGFNLKVLSKTKVANLRDEPLMAVLRYNALDTKYALKLYHKLRPGYAETRKIGTLKLQQHRLPMLAIAQKRGIPCSQKRVESFEVKFTKDLGTIEYQIAALPAVKKFARKRGAFNPASNDDVASLLRDELKREEGVRPGGKYSVDESVLSQVDTKETRLLLKHRTASKLLSTYVKPFKKGAKDGVVWPDGLIHCSFKPTATDTGRLASSGPNNQNWPKRKNKEIRKMIRAPKGWVLLSADYGQIEARVLAMASKDKAYLEAVRNNEDVHMIWTDRLLDFNPSLLDDRFHGDRKEMRGDVKNGAVFPLFYGSSEKKVIEKYELDYDDGRQLVREFWRKYAGVKRWHKKIEEFYNTNGYVEGLTGRRRYGPLSFNMAINAPIQGTASDITVDAMVRLSRYAYEEDIPWLSPNLNVHDDITLLVPESELDFAVETIVDKMTQCPFKFVNVPLVVEVESGKDWYDMKTIGEFSTAV